MANFRVIIVGGGLSGPLLANGLLNNGVDFVLYEQDFEDAKYEGYQVRLGEGTLRGFEKCLTKAHAEAIQRKFGKCSNTPETAPSIFTTRFEKLVDLSKMPSYSKSSAMNRAVLRDMLLEPIKANKRIQYKKEFQSYEIVTGDDGGERVKIHFSDGSSDISDVLIGADGSHSKINRELGLNNLVPINTHWAFLLKGSLPHTRVLELPERLRDGPLMVFSSRCCLYYALYLPDDPHGKEATGDDQKRISYDEKAASFYWGLNVPVERIPYQTASEIKNRRQLCLDMINDWAPEYHQMLSIGKGDAGATEPHVTKLTASVEPSLKWREQVQRGSGKQGHPRVWLAGDAIHPMQPNRGQGGNQAMSDCADMLPQLLKLQSISKKTAQLPNNEEVSMACREYEAVMIPRAFAWVQKSGGTSFPRLDLDGWLGTLVKFIASMVVPILQLYHRMAAPNDAQ